MVDVPSSSRRLDELGPRRRKAVIGATFATSVAIAAILVAAYYLVVPNDAADPNIALRLVGSMAVLVATIIASARFVTTTGHPLLGLVPALTAVGTVSLVGFAATYLLMSSANASAFSESLNHTGALYYSVTTSTTIGYGDIAPESDGARIVAMIHMITNVVVVGVAVRVLVHAARRRAS